MVRLKTLLENIKERYLSFTISANPHNILKMTNPSDRLKMKAIGFNPMLFSAMRDPSFQVSYFTYLRYPEALIHSQGISKDVQLSLVAYQPDTIKFLANPSDEILWNAIKRERSILKTLDLNEWQKEMLFSKDHSLFHLIKDPHSDLQIEGVRHEWRNFYSIKNPCDQVYSIVLFKTLGINHDSITPELKEATNKLLLKWKAIDVEHKTTTWSSMQSPYININDAYPEVLRDELYYIQFKHSICDFHQETGLKPNIEFISAAIENDINKLQVGEENIMLKCNAISDAIKSFSDEPEFHKLTSKELYNMAHQSTIRKLNIQTACEYYDIERIKTPTGYSFKTCPFSNNEKMALEMAL